MDPKAAATEEKPFSLERAEEDDEFEEFERDGAFSPVVVTNRLESGRTVVVRVDLMGGQLGHGESG